MWIKGNNPALDATKVPTAIDIAWSAGIWEGEGSCRLSQKRSLCVTVVQKDPELLYRLREWFGGNVRLLGPSNKDCHVWEVCGDRARIFLALIYEFLTCRRKVQVDATQALVFLGQVSSNGKSIGELKGLLESYYAADRKTKTNSPEYWRTEEFRAKNRENMRRYRANKKAKVVSIA